MIPGTLWIIATAGICLGIQSAVTADHLRTMELFITAFHHLEDLNPRMSSLALVTSLHKIASDNFTYSLESYDNHTAIHSSNSNNSFIPQLLNMNRKLFNFFNHTTHHFITDGHEERGVVLTPDGTTVALAPLLHGIELGLQAKEDSNQTHGFYLLPLAKSLSLSFLQFQNSTKFEWLGPDGCWDNVLAPIVFTLAGVPSLATDALVHGGMDGAILGKHLSVVNSYEIKLSEMLRSYYSGSMEELGHCDTALRGRYRRQNFQKITNPSLLQEKVAEALQMNRQQGDTVVENITEEGIKEFVLRYMDCPAIIPRCMWGAAPPSVPLVPLSPSLPFLYIHHTAIPSQPCLNFQMCSTKIRAIQQFHQKDRGWYDIGYSFLVGSDGYIYEGRGWMSQGAHTKGRNTVGYGVAFIGNYDAHLPSNYTMELVRHHLVKCGVRSGFLQENFTMLGHRQVVDTGCPGDSLYAEIKTWEHYRNMDPLK
ncbi:N-acetylmuramoyl-L-alanine amidase-like isoform X1 [Xyrauchen texanus]|uniref:N-acetylmuramoyl-L-alanine amidase-like isoform X1 n=1 Tax=Xyrauchen texanus TaxID=154827 RepID=UPI0022418EF3|nr:N-acetylmuramoyl-L-alanine amidase-like isoform X1 [Xyrauchen texanus]